jgi:hypothetical protein
VICLLVTVTRHFDPSWYVILSSSILFQYRNEKWRYGWRLSQD